MIRLFVAGFPRDAAKDDVLSLFRQFGVTEEGVVFPRDRRTRRKKGFAYVEVADDKSAEAAIKAFHLFEVSGKALTVCRAEDRPLKKPRRR
jgi:RNA recognition motif-containing protein